jgi:hypothetical protein
MSMGGLVSSFLRSAQPVQSSRAAGETDGRPLSRDPGLAGRDAAGSGTGTGNQPSETGIGYRKRAGEGAPLTTADPLATDAARDAIAAARKAARAAVERLRTDDRPLTASAAAGGRDIIDLQARRNEGIRLSTTELVDAYREADAMSHRTEIRGRVSSVI